jgi:hypothetical protein
MAGSTATTRYISCPTYSSLRTVQFLEPAPVMLLVGGRNSPLAASACVPLQNNLVPLQNLVPRLRACVSVPCLF